MVRPTQSGELKSRPVRVIDELNHMLRSGRHNDEAGSLLEETALTGLLVGSPLGGEHSVGGCHNDGYDAARLAVLGDDRRVPKRSR